MRRSTTLIATLLAIVALTGCSLFRDSPREAQEKQLARDIENAAGFSVFLKSEITDQQRTGVEKWLEGEKGKQKIKPS
ncbi:hypothetical protein [Paractinoplanes atraurantiacus]|uniref:hypothetical protein n=1 Tax=Paractinoplanes atraurantiacus TaxID=1036182 RepID=UPI000BE2F154|nr:hypothetical protein [Actinoplanes atraurantiacus]